MIIKIFKISTMEMCTIKNKNGLIKFINNEIGKYLPMSFTINELLSYLPVEEYYKVKPRGVK